MPGQGLSKPKACPIYLVTGPNIQGHITVELGLGLGFERKHVLQIVKYGGLGQAFLNVCQPIYQSVKTIRTKYAMRAGQIQPNVG